MADVTLTDVPGVGPRTSDSLMTLGIDTVASLAAAPIELLSTLPGFYPSRSLAVKTAAAGLLAPAMNSGATRKPSDASIGGATNKKKTSTTGKKRDKKKKKASKPAPSDSKKKKKTDRKKKKDGDRDATTKTSKASGKKKKKKKKKNTKKKR